jgi:CRP-like cAMP-binding protein
MPNAWIRRLQQFAPLPEEDRHILAGMMSRSELIPAGENIAKEGDRPSDIHVVVKGAACRYKVLSDGGRQITAYLLPGDACDIHMYVLKEMDHSIAALRPTEIANIPHAQMLKIADEHPRIARALWWSTLQDEAISREWLTNNGRRDAYAGIAHLLYEVFLRLRAVNETTGHLFELPVNQQELADTLSITPVHVNRILKRLRADKLITLRGKALTILDPEGLMAAADFNTNYLHFS